MHESLLCTDIMMVQSNLREIFSFLDQAYCRRSFEKGVVEIMQMGADIFRDSIGLDDMIQPHLISGILASFDRSATHDEEMSEVHIFRDHGPGKKHVEMMQSLAMYRPHFESAYLESTTAFAKAKAQEIAGIEDRSSASGYVQSYLALEANRAECIKLEIETLTKALDIITIHLVNNLSTYWTARSAFDALVVSGDSAALSRINTLFARNGLEDELAIPWSEACLTAGRSILDKPQEDVVQRLLELKADLDQLLATCFLGRQNLAVSMRKSFELFMNERRPGEAWSTNNSKIAEMIAKYVDRLLRDGPKAIAVRRQQQLQGDDEVDESNDMKSDDRELERALDSGLDLFRFVRGKDVFEAFYKKDLAKRLLLNRSASDAAEQYMMGVLRNECGDAFTQNLEMMFKDVDLAKDTNTGFKELEEKAGGSSNGVDLSVQVLSSAAWPTYQELQLSIPSSIGRQLQRFKEYYGTKHKGRNLVWRHLMSHAILRANLPGGYKELQVSALQAAVLLMFEDATNEDALSYDAIAMGTQLGKSHVSSCNPDCS